MFRRRVKQRAHTQSTPAGMMPNPLLSAVAAKKAKKEAKSASVKRKAADDAQGGLLIVRAPNAEPAQAQPPPPKTASHFAFAPPPTSSQPAPINGAGPSSQPSKKFKAGPPTAARARNAKLNSATRDRVAYSGAYDDVEAEKDVRAMDDEADNLRRQRRAHSTIDTSVIPPSAARGKGKAKMTDIIIPMPVDDSPQIERNKQLRQGAMDAITGNRGRSIQANPNDASRSQRRKSSISGRGKRQSTSFENTGVITQPHNSVSESSFYKHIDCDLPEPERVRQLLIWCSLRAGSAPPNSKSPPTEPLPPLSSPATNLLKKLQDSLVRMLAEKRINTSLYSSEAGSSRKPSEELRENKQNVQNRQWEVTYTQHIQQAQTEEESWKKVSYGYDAYAKKLQASLEQRSAALKLDHHSLSLKAKGKRPATGDLDGFESNQFPQEHELPSAFRYSLSLAKDVLGQHAKGDERQLASSRYGSKTSKLNREQIEAELKRRMAALEFQHDQLFNWANTIRVTTGIAERALNERFDTLTANLASRVALFPATAGDAVAGPSTQLLSMHVTQLSAQAGTADPLTLLRALSRVDKERPPGQVGDAARQAAREVQRAGESNPSLTVPATPNRRPPGTPRRGATPSRG